MLNFDPNIPPSEPDSYLPNVPENKIEDMFANTSRPFSFEEEIAVTRKQHSDDTVWKPSDDKGRRFPSDDVPFGESEDLGEYVALPRAVGNSPTLPTNVLALFNKPVEKHSSVVPKSEIEVGADAYDLIVKRAESILAKFKGTNDDVELQKTLDELTRVLPNAKTLHDLSDVTVSRAVYKDSLELTQLMVNLYTQIVAFDRTDKKNIEMLDTSEAALEYTTKLVEANVPALYEKPIKERATHDTPTTFKHPKLKD